MKRNNRKFKRCESNFKVRDLYRWYNDWFANPYRIMKSYILTRRTIDARKWYKRSPSLRQADTAAPGQTLTGSMANGYANFYVSTLISSIYDRSTYDLRLLLSPTWYTDSSRQHMLVVLKLLRNYCCSVSVDKACFSRLSFFRYTLYWLC